MADDRRAISIIVEYQVEASRKALLLERLAENCRETLPTALREHGDQ